MYSIWGVIDWNRVFFIDECAVQSEANCRRWTNLSIRREMASRLYKTSFWKIGQLHDVGKHHESCCEPYDIMGQRNPWQHQLDLLSTYSFFLARLLAELLWWTVDCEDMYDSDDDDVIHVQMDKASARWAMITRNRITERGIPLPDWIENSPNLNPIEEVWSIIKRRINRRVSKILIRRQINEALTEEWKALKAEDFSHLIDSMPRRIQEVIDNDGGHTHW